MKILKSPRHMIYALLGVALLLLGLIGLVIPVIPGLLFLFVAVYLLGKVSTRVKRWSDGNATLAGVHRQFDRMGQVSVLDRVRVGSLMLLGAVVGLVDKAADGLAKVVSRRQ